MSNDRNDYATGGEDEPGPQFDPDRTARQDRYAEQTPPSGWQDPNTQPSKSQPYQSEQYGYPAYDEPPPPSQQSYAGRDAYPDQDPFAGQQFYAGQQPYAGQQAWSVSPPQTMPPAERSNTLGITGLVLVVLATGALIAAAWAFGTGLADLFLNLAETGFPRDPDALMNDPRTIAYAESAVGPIAAGVLSCLVGFIGWVISIVATATRRGRTFGIIGITVGVLALPLAYGAVSLVLSPVINQLGG